MKAMAIHARPSIGQLASEISMHDLPQPMPHRGQVRVKVEASSINVDDQHFAEGTMFGGFPIAPRPTGRRPWIPGTDLVGVVDALGPGVTKFRIGQHVFGIRPPSLPGPWAELCITKAEFLHPVPGGWPIPECAALCLGGMVVCSIVAALGDLANRRVLVLGASGGIGTLLVPVLASQGADVIGVCSSANLKLVEARGATRVIEYDRKSYREQLEEQKLDAVVDLVGGLQNERDGLAVTLRNGHFVTIVGPEKHVGEQHLGAFRLIRMIGHILWLSLTSRLRGPRYHLVGPTRPDFVSMHRLIVDVGILPAIDCTVPFEERAIRDAIRYVASHRARGKVVIQIAEPTTRSAY